MTVLYCYQKPNGTVFQQLFPKRVQFLSKALCVCVYLQVPDTGSVEEGRVDLSHTETCPHVPHIQTVFAVHPAQPMADGFTGHRHCVRVAGVRLVGEQVAEESESKKNCMLKREVGTDH